MEPNNHEFVEANEDLILEEETPVEESPEDPIPFIHGHHTCDGCKVFPIIGKRFHATNALDYDLCEKCHSNYVPFIFKVTYSSAESESESAEEEEDEDDDPATGDEKHETDAVAEPTLSEAAVKTEPNDSAQAKTKAESNEIIKVLLRGTLSYDLERSRHIIQGNWNYEGQASLAEQQYELLRTLDTSEDPKVLPKDGEFHGRFSLASYFDTTSKRNQNERMKVHRDNGVKIKFTLQEGERDSWNVDGTGTNRFGIFRINGTAKPSWAGDDVYDVELRKRYEPSSLPAPVESETAKKPKKRKILMV